MNEHGNGTRSLRDILHAADEPGDPAPTSTILPMERAHAIVRNIAATTLDELRQLRDKIDDLIRATQAAEDEVSAKFAAFAERAEQTIECKRVIADSVDRLCENYEVTRRLGPTLTHKPEERR